MKIARIKRNTLLYSARVLLVSTLIIGSSIVSASGNGLIDAVMRSDFIFDRNVSDVPFIPLGYININQQRNADIKTGCMFASCEFDLKSYSQGFGMPVWVGKKNMLILGETLESNTISGAFRNIKVNSGGLLGAWISQPNQHWQLGAFMYAYRGIGNDELAREPKGNISGAVGRYRHSPHFHSYWGMVRFYEYGEDTLYPYIGFDWYIGKKWSIGGVMPWPTITYASTKDTILKFGALYSSTEWAFDNEGKALVSDFGKWDIGLAAEHKLSKLLWGEVAFGYSGFGKLYIRSGSNIEYESEIENSPFIRFSINLRVD